jgi:hypothetical protein
VQNINHYYSNASSNPKNALANQVVQQHNGLTALANQNQKKTSMQANTYVTNNSQSVIDSRLGLSSNVTNISQNVSMQISGMSGHVSGNHISGNTPITFKGAPASQLPS